VALASAVGATIEWYDFFLYGTAAGLVFDKLFFNGLDGWAAQFAAFGTFAVGFLARPVGGLILGHFGDRLGRKKMLLMTLVIMGVGTAAIGLLPSYDSIGVWAPILLGISPAATRNHRDGPRNGATRRTLLDTTGPLLRPGRRGAGRCAAPGELRGAGAGGAPAAARAPRRRAGR
jgi:MFS family permease